MPIVGSCGSEFGKDSQHKHTASELLGSEVYGYAVFDCLSSGGEFSEHAQGCGLEFDLVSYDTPLERVTRALAVLSSRPWMGAIDTERPRV